MSRSGSGSPRRRRLSRSGDFKRVYRDGSSKASRYLVLYRFKRSDDDSSEARLGVSVSKKLGDAVARNRVKRVLREAFWDLVDRDSANQDFVLVARPAIAQVIEDRGLEGAIECVVEVAGSTDTKEAGRST
jgi:ribonuclease P protein component